MKKIIGLTLWVIAIALEVSIYAYNIDMTELRLFISYPLYHVIATLLIVLGYLVMTHKGHRKM